MDQFGNQQQIQNTMSKINRINYTKRFSFLLMLVVITSGLLAQQNKVNNGKQPITISVTDENGKALPQTQVVIGEGEEYLVTDKNGKVEIKVNKFDYLKFSFSGYEEQIILAENLKNGDIVKLKSLALLTSPEDVVHLPYIDMYKRNITGSTVVISGKELERYTGSDIRNAFTGLIAGLEVRELNGSPGLNVIERYNGNPEKIDIQLRGRSPMYIVDGIPTDMTEMPLDPSEIESATIIKDIVAKAMYGPVAADGIILIKTYRGKINERTIKVNVEKGTSIVDRMPIWTDGSDYARLNNLARVNSGIPTKYTDDAIAKYATNDGFNMYFPSNDFRSMMFKNTMDYNRLNLSTSGGNEGIRYYSYLGLTNEGDLFKIGSAADYNRIVSRSNLDIKINDQLKMRLGIYGALGIRRSPVYDTGGEYLAMNSAIVDANTIPPVVFPIYANNSSELTEPWFAVSSNYGNNPIGELTGKGFSNEASRIGSTNIAFDFDMSHLVKGLSSETYLGFNILNQVKKGKALNYTAYTVTPTLTAGGVDSVILTKVHDGTDQSGLSKLSDYYFQTFTVSQTFKHEAKIGKANLLNTLSYDMSRATRDGYTDDQRQQNVSWSGLLNFDNRFSLQAVVNYAGTYSFIKENRYATFPSIGASWVISEEKFMKSVGFIDFLKLRAETGVLGYDNFQAPFYYRDNYTTSNSGTTSAFGPSTSGWLGSATETNVPRTYPNRIGNPNLNWEKRREMNAGLDARMFSNKLNLEFTYYNSLRDGIISQVSNVIPSVLGLSGTTPRQNFEKIRYTGVELALKYTDKLGNLDYTIGGNASMQDAVYEKVDEPNYRNAYQSLVGKSIYSYTGLTYLGQYQTDAEALEVPSLYDAVLHAGDFKYKDMNNDKVIDDNDRSVIGNTAPRLIYSVNIDLKYKNFELYVLGTGRAFYDFPLTNSYFWNGWGDGNYSSFVRNNLATGLYPKLTYYKVENNFRGSNFWLTDGSFFKVQDVQLAYNFPQKLVKSLGVRTMSVFVNGTNLYTITKVKYVDPESINSGITTYPLFINLTGGIKLTF